MVFFHIPLEEYKLAWNEYVENGYQDNQDIQYRYGTVGESGGVICTGIHSDNFFEAMEEIGSTQGVFVGHYLAYFGIYKLGSQRGCTVIEVSPDTGFDCHGENYYQDKYQILADGTRKEDVTMQVLGAEE